LDTASIYDTKHLLADGGLIFRMEARNIDLNIGLQKISIKQELICSKATVQILVGGAAFVMHRLKHG